MNRAAVLLKNYTADNPRTQAKLSRLFGHGRLAGTGRLLILPVDQGFEHGPTRSFGANPDGYDPRYHAALALEAGLSAYAAPLGFIEVIAREFSKKLPLILKVNNSDLLSQQVEPIPALTSSVMDAMRLGCVAVGFTIYPGSSRSKEMYEQAAGVIREAKARGLGAVIWAYPRGSGLGKDAETALDVVAYGAHIACQLGAHIVKVKFPSELINQPEAKTLAEKGALKSGSLVERVRHVIQAAFAGRRPVVFSGGPARSDEELFGEVQAIREGGGTGSIIGRNVFQRPKDKALKLLASVLKIYAQP